MLEIYDFTLLVKIRVLQCISQEPELETCIEVMKSKWLDYYANIPIIYLLGLIFDPRCKLDSLTMCLENYYNFLDLEVDINSIVSNVKSTFYLLYDEYIKFYGCHNGFPSRLGTTTKNKNGVAIDLFYTGVIGQPGFIFLN